MFLFSQRSEKQRKRPRHIYALIFANNCCYIGQSVHLKRRLSQHQHRKGGWDGQKFQMVRLQTVKDTYAGAENWEFAWRVCAQRKGWRIYGLPPNIVVDSQRKATRQQLSLANKCKWPTRFSSVGGIVQHLMGRLIVAGGLFLALTTYMGWNHHLLALSQWMQKLIGTLF